MELRAEGNFEGYTLIVGFPGIGLVGIIAAKHLVDELNMRYVGFLAGDDLPAVATVRGGISYPPIRLYADEEHRILCLISDLVIPEGTAIKIAEAVVRFAKERKIAKILSLAGIIVPGAAEGEVYGVGATGKDLHELGRYNIRPVEKGMTTGISAAILLAAAGKGIPAALVLGQLHTKEDFRAAADVIRKLDEMLGLNVDVGDLIEKAEQIEREVAEMVRRLGQGKEKYSTPMYG